VRRVVAQIPLLRLENLEIQFFTSPTERRAKNVRIDQFLIKYQQYQQYQLCLYTVYSIYSSSKFYKLPDMPDI